MHTGDPTTTGRRDPGRYARLRLAVSGFVGIGWALSVLAIVAIGRCDAFGGRCDGTSPPLLDDDVAGGVFVGTAMAAWLVWWLRRPSRRGAVLGVGVALAVATLAALVARSLAHG